MKKILIIEDDQIVANIYRNKFSVEGYQVEIATDGQAGLDTMHQFHPDAIVLDLMLPKITGVELMKKVRAEKEFQKLPIVVFSNTYLTNMVQEAWKAGATKCLSKANCSPKQLLEVVRATLAPNGVAGPMGGATPAHPTPANGAVPATHLHPANHKPATPGPMSPKPAHSAAATVAHASPAAPASSPPQSAAASAEAEFQSDVRKTMLDGLPATLSALRLQLQTLIKAGNEPAREKMVQEMYRRIHGLTGNAGLTGLVLIAQMSDALEALLKELHEKPKNINASTLRTVASAIDFLGVLFERGVRIEQKEGAPASILVVDDEPISRRAITYALERAKLKSVNIEDSQMAYNLLCENRFDLIFLDVDMPGMNGFELCSKLRTLPAHKQTPVVFVTGLTGFESRANSMVSGGNDFIAKPFLFMELAVKAMVFILKRRLEQGEKLKS